MIIGDFNSHFPRWNYNRSNRPGKILEDFLDSTAATYHSTNGHIFFPLKEKNEPRPCDISFKLIYRSFRKLLESCNDHGHEILGVKRSLDYHHFHCFRDMHPR
ncbi:hypothetical protein CDAR_185751 [Caerostris darwini]|uniref:Endonuclease/exonuclease/phosphatase domain-containing protein n=1 Tax=Caerostris darwini TaxID=1538125 RepID=A0AAV4T9W0_9ARAC|nr:hypothetical protein CDAR_185751 [Caerostris darwini]